MKVKVLKICAWGCSHSMMTIKINDIQMNIYIPRDVYYLLKKEGIPTSQSLRYARRKG